MIRQENITSGWEFGSTVQVPAWQVQGHKSDPQDQNNNNKNLASVKFTSTTFPRCVVNNYQPVFSSFPEGTSSQSSAFSRSQKNAVRG